MKPRKKMRISTIDDWQQPASCLQQHPTHTCRAGNVLLYILKLLQVITVSGGMLLFAIQRHKDLGVGAEAKGATKPEYRADFRMHVAVAYMNALWLIRGAVVLLRLAAIPIY